MEAEPQQILQAALLGQRGGYKRAERLSAEQRSAISRHAARARWHSHRINHASKSELLAKLPPIKSDREGNTYVVWLLPDGLDFSSLSLLYLVSYSMGMLARYYPSKWLSLLNSSKGDFAFPLMRAANTVVEDRFPQLVLQELDDSLSLS